MKNIKQRTDYFGTEKISKILEKSKKRSYTKRNKVLEGNCEDMGDDNFAKSE